MGLSTTKTVASVLLLLSIFTMFFPVEVLAFSFRQNSAKYLPASSGSVKAPSITAAASTILIIGHVLSFPSMAFALGDIGKGEVLFNNNCASCHIGGNNVVNEQRTLKRDALEKFGIGLDQPGIKDFVTNSLRHKNLVFFRVEGGKLNPEQWEDVTTYISDQAKGDKW